MILCRAVVTQSSSRRGPPNAGQVTFFAGTSISQSIVPSGAKRRTFAAPHPAFHKYP